MSKKYWVPALQRADSILELISQFPSSLRLMDLSNKLQINKSSMFSLLHTMETLHWVVREKGDTYALGSVFGSLGNAYFKQFNLVELFHKEAEKSKNEIGESLQLSKLDHHELLYLAKVEADTPVRLISEPGMRFPPHATGMGKMLISILDSKTFEEMYPNEELVPVLTKHTLVSKQALLEQLSMIRSAGVAIDYQESVIGFCCIAAPVYNRAGQAIAAVSFSMPIHQWEVKKELAQEEIQHLAKRLSIID